MKFLRYFFSLPLLLACIVTTHPSHAISEKENFQIWLSQYKIWAQTQGITEETLNIAFANINEPRSESLKADAKQAEFTLSFSDYYGRTVSAERLQRAIRLGRQHQALLDETYAKYGVPPAYLLAFWALESNFGDYTGKVPVIHTLATLAYDLRRREFFQKELLQALRILQAGDININNMRGSWAGAMGQTQFMPSTFTQYAIDGNNDGKRDLWHNLADIFHSSANFLAKIGWQKNQNWGYQVRLPQNFNYQNSGIKKQNTLQFWHQQGITMIDETPLPQNHEKAALIIPAGHAGPAFIVTQNFQVIMRWNNSILYALSVALLAEQIQQQAQYPTTFPHSESLPTALVIRLQQKLKSLKYDPGPIDGIIGSQTKNALQKFQTDNNLPSDGYPSNEILQKLKLL